MGGGLPGSSRPNRPRPSPLILGDGNPCGSGSAGRWQKRLVSGRRGPFPLGMAEPLAGILVAQCTNPRPPTPSGPGLDTPSLQLPVYCAQKILFSRSCCPRPPDSVPTASGAPGPETLVLPLPVPWILDCGHPVPGSPDLEIPFLPILTPRTWRIQSSRSRCLEPACGRVRNGRPISSLGLLSWTLWFGSDPKLADTGNEFDCEIEPRSPTVPTLCPPSPSQGQGFKPCPGSAGNLRFLSSGGMKSGGLFVLVALVALSPLPGWMARTGVRPGICPIPQRTFPKRCVELCRGDNSCPPGYKCCSNGCGRECMVAVRVGIQRSGSCPASPPGTKGSADCVRSCRRDTTCPQGQKCCSFGCSQVCTTPVKGVTQRPGTCPQLSPRTKGACDRRCRTDDSCPQGQKCCTNGCDYYCMDPVKTTILRPGTCPNLSPRTKGSCVRYCSTDDSCPQGLKCCTNGCDYYCMAPVQDRVKRPSTCPPMSPSTKGTCVQQCRGDDSCPKGQMCCSNGCDSYCSPPVEEGSKNVCEKSADPGPCKSYMAVYYFNSRTKNCEAFMYGGCGGNDNRFRTAEECMARCGGSKNPVVCSTPSPGTKGNCDQDCRGDNSCGKRQRCCAQGCGQVCDAPVKGVIQRPGTCPRVIPGTKGTCAHQCRGDFSCPWGHKCCSNGCGYVCMQVVMKSSRDICEEPVEVGRCMGHIPMYYYNSKTKKCESFIYGGCQGNENQFKTIEECMARCGGSVKLGRCPISRKEISEPCVEECKGDDSCPVGQKCCVSGCSQVCMLSVKDDPWLHFS
uniref:WAP four-disulfide core domain 8 n=1 Tax=Ornithorhynchus anatinus TaxID=9258 RepID=A0A6I8PHS6_ORNAN